MATCGAKKNQEQNEDADLSSNVKLKRGKGWEVQNLRQQDNMKGERYIIFVMIMFVIVIMIVIIIIIIIMIIIIIIIIIVMIKGQGRRVLKVAAWASFQTSASASLSLAFLHWLSHFSYHHLWKVSFVAFKLAPQDEQCFTSLRGWLLCWNDRGCHNIWPNYRFLGDATLYLCFADATLLWPRYHAGNGMTWTFVTLAILNFPGTCWLLSIIVTSTNLCKTSNYYIESPIV